MSKISHTRFLNFNFIFSENLLWNYKIGFCLVLKIHKKTYFLLPFSTDFNKRGLKWMKKSISKLCRARFLNFHSVFWKLDFEIFWKLSYLIINVENSQKTYLLLHFSTEFDKQGLKWKNIPISKISRAGLLNFDSVFRKLDFEIFFIE